MNLKHIAAAALLATAASASFAATTDVGTLAPSASFSNTVMGAFTDIWTFNLSGPSAVAASLTNIEITFAPGGPVGGILGFAADLNGTSLLPSGSTQITGPITISTKVLAGATTLPAGVYQLTVSGTGITGASASYGGNIVATPVPEPETYALMLAGLAAVGFMASRRRSKG